MNKTDYLLWSARRKNNKLKIEFDSLGYWHNLGRVFCIFTKRKRACLVKLHFLEFQFNNNHFTYFFKSPLVNITFVWLNLSYPLINWRIDSKSQKLNYVEWQAWDWRYHDGLPKEIQSQNKVQIWNHFIFELETEKSVLSKSLANKWLRT